MFGKDCNRETPMADKNWEYGQVYVPHPDMFGGMPKSGLDLSRIIEIQRRNGGAELDVTGHGYNAAVMRIHQRSLHCRAVQLDFVIAQVSKSLYQHEIEALQIQRRQHLGQCGFLVARPLHDPNLAGVGGDQGLHGAGFPQFVAIFTRIVDIESMVGVFDDPDPQLTC